MTVVLAFIIENEDTQRVVEFEEDISEIVLSKRRITNIDLTPLSSCTNLQSLNLASNKLQFIDLTPLSSCAGLHELDLTFNELQKIDVTPLFHQLIVGRKCPLIKHDKGCTCHSWIRKRDAVYERPTVIYPWRFLHLIPQQFGKDSRLQQDLLYAMRLVDYGFIDCDLTDHFLSFLPTTPIEEVHSRVVDVLVEEIVAAVDRDGATTGLNIEELISHHSTIAVNAQRIIELREV